MLVLLVLIYRSPVLLWLPLIAVGFAEFTSKGVGYLASELGATVSGQSSGIMSILVLGAGTDYALLVVARYREELRHHENRHDALRLAMQSAGPAVFASGLTVAAGLLTLTLASVKGTAGLGPLGAIGVAVAMLAMLTLLPALFSIVPRGVFWPKTPRFGDEGGDATHGAFRRVGSGSRRVRGGRGSSPRRCCWCALRGSLRSIRIWRRTRRSSATWSRLRAASSSRARSRRRERADAGLVPDASRAQAVASALRGVDGVAATQVAGSGEAGAIVNVTLEDDRTRRQPRS